MYKKTIAIAILLVTFHCMQASSEKDHFTTLTTVINEAKQCKAQNSQVFHRGTVVMYTNRLEQVIISHPSTQDFTWNVAGVVAEILSPISCLVGGDKLVVTNRFDNALAAAEAAREHLRQNKS
jgi:hypothetical protein